MANTLHGTPATASTTGTSVGMSEPPEHEGAIAHKAHEARHEAGQVARDAKREAQRTVAQTRQQLEHRADEQARNMAGSLRDVGRQLQSMAAGTSSGTGMVNDVVRQIADGVEGAARRLDDGGLQAAMTDLRRFARNRPAVFLAGAVGAGIVVGRVLRASDLHALTDAARADQESGGDAQGISTWAYGETAALGGALPGGGYSEPIAPYDDRGGVTYGTPPTLDAPLSPASTEVRR